MHHMFDTLEEGGVQRRVHIHVQTSSARLLTCSAGTKLPGRHPEPAALLTYLSFFSFSFGSE